MAVDPKADAIETPSQPTPDDEALGDESGDEVVHQIITEQLGESIAEIMRQARRAEEAWHRRNHPEEGLRERKRRLTRQFISDAATSLFVTRGFENVTVSEVAERVGVSEKTVYNYFPTKESMVLDMVDESIERLAQALRQRRPDESLSATVITALMADMDRFQDAPDELIDFFPMFGEMIDKTPALRAAVLEVHDRLAKVAREELAAQAEVDPRDPEPTAAGRALAGLADVAFESQSRRIREGLRGAELRATVSSDLDRAARLLETGLWSFGLLSRGGRAKTQALEAAKAADEARVQVVSALRQARAAWMEVRRQGQAIKEAKSAHRGRPRQ